MSDLGLLCTPIMTPPSFPGLRSGSRPIKYNVTMNKVECNVELVCHWLFIAYRTEHIKTWTINIISIRMLTLQKTNNFLRHGLGQSICSLYFLWKIFIQLFLTSLKLELSILSLVAVSRNTSLFVINKAKCVSNVFLSLGLSISWNICKKNIYRRSIIVGIKIFLKDLCADNCVYNETHIQPNVGKDLNRK